MDVIVYHKDCPDGFCAAFVAKKKYPDARLYGAVYGEPELTAADILNEDVLFVDFSYPRQSLLDIAAAARSVTVIDHHKTAEADLVGVEDFLELHFDMTRSGAGLTWDVLHEHTPRPWYVDYVEDRDLWNWKLPYSKEISGYIMALPHTLEAWGTLDSLTVQDALVSGKAINLHIDHYIEKVGAQYQTGFIGMYKTAVINAAYPNISDVLNDVLKNGFDIGLGYFERNDGKIQVSLRSRGDLDVSVLAKQVGGGGHKNAAGFQVPYQEGRIYIDKVLGR